MRYVALGALEALGGVSGRLWKALGGSGRLWGGSGRLWGALGMLWEAGGGSGRLWEASGCKKLEKHIKSYTLRRVFGTFHQKAVVLLDVFVSSRHFTRRFEGHFSKSTCFFSSGGRRGTDRNRGRQERVLSIWKSEPYHARRMFRE